MTNAVKRQMADLAKAPSEHYMARPTNDSNVLKWDGHICGAVGTPYEGGTFKFDMDFPADFPIRAPKVTFKTKIYHPGFLPDGDMCLELLKKEWTPKTKIKDILDALYSLIASPSPDMTLNSAVSDQLKNTPAEFEKTAREWTKQFAQ
ncbi:putative Ubiquitin-conjugating enzyme E2 4 [Blattamonas nauphoetae]|uniref:Ubiquitin-conjugating enzyme E2 4 n=1 Tax=Blattamonas nauphoetae TaxID=2049346 RepID=A0ABQ9YM69_9EUKA|nr:putative Ubiquitin-conjugating enzyme E2 4 [Blattamonas nauphoetae]